MAERDGGQAGAWMLGLAGLVPFFGAAAALWLGPATLRGVALLALLAYAAVILSFLGGVRWGLEIARPEGPRPATLALSVLPALAAWLVLIGNLRTSASVQLLGFVIAFAVVGAWDTRSVGLPPWYRRLRLTLSAGAIAAMLVGYLAARQLG